MGQTAQTCSCCSPHCRDGRRDFNHATPPDPAKQVRHRESVLSKAAEKTNFEPVSLCQAQQFAVGSPLPAHLPHRFYHMAREGSSYPWIHTLVEEDAHSTSCPAARLRNSSACSRVTERRALEKVIDGVTVPQVIEKHFGQALACPQNRGRRSCGPGRSIPLDRLALFALPSRLLD